MFNMSIFLFNPPGITVKIIRMDCAHMAGHAMITTFMGHCLLRMLLFVLEDFIWLFIAKRGRPLRPTKSQMELIPVALAF